MIVRFVLYILFQILAISSIDAAYPVQNQFINGLPSLGPYSNYEVLVNRPYPAPHAVIYEQPEAGPLANYNDLTSFEQLPSAIQVPSTKLVHRKSHSTPTYHKEEIKDVIEDVLKLMIDQRLCEVNNANGGSITKRSIGQNFASRAASSADIKSLNQQHLAFLKDLKPEDIKELIIKLLTPGASALATNRTLPLQQQSHSELPILNMPTSVWHTAPLQMPVFHSSPYIQNHLIPFRPFSHQQIISYEPLESAAVVQYHLINPYTQPPVAQPIVLNRMPPSSSPFVYSLQISAPVPSNQVGTKPSTSVPDSQIPDALKPFLLGEDSSSKPAFSSISMFSDSRILQPVETTTKKQVISTEKSQIDLRNPPANNVDNSSKVSTEETNPTVLKDKPTKRTAKSAYEDSVESGQVQPEENEQLLEAFKAIRENLKKNHACRITTTKRRAINERQLNGNFIRNPNYHDYLNRHAIPTFTLPSRHHSPTARIQYHKYAPHTLLRSSVW
ncbi:hypothetical protein V9T40_011174 [Parthenolecanium corni]|uniref:Uncharacterized protein n=1 Tax=Parthenolecanium corni TaxID=536013 RepID=A0AAN9T505_9HEMI